MDQQGRSSQPLFEAENTPEEDHGDCVVVCYKCNPLQLHETWRDHHRREVVQRTGQNAQKTPTFLRGVSEQKGPILLHDNARPHISKVTLLKLDELGYETLPHSPYSPDFSPTDYRPSIENDFRKFVDSKSSDF
ncbi:hypothetical protein RB195_024027 [Necator americanus]|uniref:Histone-lysine N-methyltransferase SETMAR n=1 Tax=Necator americanus TaxID=51031 RepID=A0ABR1EMC8_NECAM